MRLTDGAGGWSLLRRLLQQGSAGRPATTILLSVASHQILPNKIFHVPWSCHRIGLRITWETETVRVIGSPVLESPVQAPILNRLGNVSGLDLFGAGEVGDRAADFEDAAVGAGAQA